MKSLAPFALVACFYLAGCATPAPVVEQAKLGVSMIAELEDALQSYRTLQTRSEQYLAFALVDEQMTLSLARETNMREQLSLNAVASPEAAEVQKRLLLLIKGLEEIQANRITAVEIEAQTAKLLTPLPSTTDASSAAQAAMARLSKELPAETRFKEGRAFFDAVRNSLKDANKKIKEAEAAAAAPAAP